MSQRLITLLLQCVLAVTVLVACSGTPAVSTDSTSDNQAVQVIQNTTTSTNTPSTETTSPTTTSTSTTTASATATTVLAENSTTTPIEATTTDSDAAVQILLQGSTMAVEGAGVTVDGSVATITAGGTYSISGTLDNGQILVDSADNAPVYLILSGATINNSTSAAIYVRQAEAAEIILAEGTTNSLTDGSTYLYASAEEDEPNATLFSDDALVISGSGTLTVQGNYNDGIASKDGLTITGGTLNVTATDDGIRGKDYLIVEDGIITVNAGGDGLKADNADDATLGYIALSGGRFTITAGGDGMQAETDLVVTAGDLTVVAGGGSSATFNADLSLKGLKAGVNLMLEGGIYSINAADDALHSNSDITINGGTYVIASGDDGIHGETNLTVNGGEIQVIDSYEGIESANITLNAGNVSIVSSDDGVNAASNDGTTATAGGPQGGRGGPGGNFTLNINGGTLVVNSAGDGLDANGTITMTDGLVIVNGPTERMNGALDYDGGFTLSGGTMVAVGSSGMASAPDNSSSQNALLIFFNSAQPAGTLVHIEDSAGNPILTFTPTKSYQSLAFSSLALTAGETYQVYLGGSITGTATNGFVTDGSYTGGTLYTSVTVSGVVTQVGSGGGGFR
jgi:hypothetical protein